MKCRLLIQTRRLSTASPKVDIRPLFKKIHPDLYAMESAEVQKENLACLQTVQELSGQIQYTLDLLKPISLNSPQSVVFNRPFQAVYRLHCYTHSVSEAGDSTIGAEQEAEEEAVEKLSRVAITILTPPALRRNPITNVAAFRNALTQFLSNHAKLWHQLGLDYPWQSELQSDNEGKGGAPSGEQFGLRDLHINKSEMELRAYDYAVTKRAFKISNSSMLRDIPRYSRYGKNLHFKVMEQNRKAEIDHYFKKHLHLSNISPEEEFDVVEKFRNFLIDYGDIVNFNPLSWNQLFVLLHKDIPTNSAKGGNQISGQLAFEVKTVKKSMIVRIPSNFRSAKLIDFLHENVPCSLFDLSSEI